jgi:hypothetical protein
MIDPSFNGLRPIRVGAGRGDLLEQDAFTQQVVQDRIGHQLREMYSDLMKQPLPDHLASLLVQLQRESEGGRE